MPEIVSKTVHVRFSTQQRATLADQMADVQSQIDGVEDEKKKAMGTFNGRLKVLRARMHEFATAVREGEGDVVVECMWKPDANKPFEHLWRLDVWEVVESRPLTGKAAEKAAEAQRQLDLVTPTPAGDGDGRAMAAGGAPGEKPAREAAKVLRLRVGPTPPCPAPVPGAPGGICGADGDPDFFDGFCQPHHAQLPEAERAGILEAIADVRRQMRTQEAVERRAKEQRIATAAEEDAARDAAHKAADEASGAALDAIGGPLGCARLIEEGKGGEGEPVKAPETDDDYRARVKVAIDQAHRAATARAAVHPKDMEAGPKPEAVPPIVREKPREVTADLIAQLAAASREAAGVAPDAPETETPGASLSALLAATSGVRVVAVGVVPEPVTVPDGDAPPEFGDEPAPQSEDVGEWIARADDADPDEPAPGNEAAPPPPPDEVLDGPQPLYNQRNAEGWPLCPSCGEDELESASVPRSEARIVRCNACGWRPPAETVAPIAAAAPEWCAALRRQVTPAEKGTGKATCASCGKVVAIRPVAEDGAYVATLPKHKRQVTPTT